MGIQTKVRYNNGRNLGKIPVENETKSDFNSGKIFALDVDNGLRIQIRTTFQLCIWDTI